MRKSIFLFSILISIVVLGEDNPNDIVSRTIDGTQALSNVTCRCTEDEQCDLNSRTCQLKHSDHACYQSWSKEIEQSSVQVSAG